MRLRPWQIFAVFCFFLLVLVGAVGGISATLMRLARSEALARQQADQQERVRLALWRMDSALAPLIARESARPAESFSDPTAFEQADWPEGEGLDRLLLCFELGQDGEPRAPWAPGEGEETARGRLAQLLGGLERGQLERSLAAGSERLRLTIAERPASDGLRAASADKLDWSRRAVSVQQMAVSNAFYAQQNGAEAASGAAGARSTARQGGADGASGIAIAARRRAPPVETVMTPVWAGDSLLLARKARLDGEERLQACVLDWPSARARLLGEIADLLPGADLVRLGERASAEEASCQLASLPATLVLPRAGPAPEPGGSTVAVLVAVWLSVGIAILAVGLLLLGTLALGERRAVFVSAVTHELRTPLTTFRMYTEMLAEGMVREPERQRSYLQTLRAEATRLGHLVENVLAYSRIERGRANATSGPVSATELIGRIAPRLRERAAQAGMALELEPDAPHEVWLVADLGAVDQILFNLVDNACKYAAGASDRRIHLSTEPEGRRVALRVRDHGNGVARDVRRRLFSPFSRSAEKAAGSAPGVGLGLALSRRLARGMGGELRLEQSDGGACFALSLPAASRPPEVQTR